MQRPRALAPQPARRQLIQLAALAVLMPSAYPAQAQLAVATAINRAARFRALSQRCAKAYCQLYLNTMPEDAQDIMSTAQRLIQRGFEDLARGNFAPDVVQQIAQTQQESAALTKLMATPPSKSSIVAVSAQADKMLTAADQATRSLEASAKLPSAKLVNLAGRQRMLSQRLAKNYFLGAAGADSKELRAQIAQDRLDFTNALNTLKAAPLSNDNIRHELTLGQQQWIFFEPTLDRKPVEKDLRTVATSSERLLEVMNNLATLYESALKELMNDA